MTEEEIGELLKLVGRWNGTGVGVIVIVLIISSCILNTVSIAISWDIWG